MKLISLNTWGGRNYEPLMQFFKKNKDVDIFCLQEIYHKANPKEVDKEWIEDALNLYTDISQILTNHVGYFRPSIKDWYGLAVFIKKDILIEEEGDIWIYEKPDYINGGNHPRNLQYLKFSNGQEQYLVANVHGLWTGTGKNDTEHRLEQSRRIKTFLNSVEGKKILCGDFNLLPHTESIKMLEKDLRNLIGEYKVESTRTNLYTKPDKHADYIFVSSDIKVKHFEVLPDVVSDHSPLLIEF